MANTLPTVSGLESTPLQRASDSAPPAVLNNSLVLPEGPLSNTDEQSRTIKADISEDDATTMSVSTAAISPQHVNSQSGEFHKTLPAHASSSGELDTAFSAPSPPPNSLLGLSEASAPALIELSAGAIEASHVSSHTTPLKRFTAVNVNRKFLEKTSSSATPTAPPQTSKTAHNGTSLRAPMPTQASHSRLVTAKLTPNTQLPHPPAPGWLKSNSAASSSAATPTSQATPAGTTSNSPAPILPASSASLIGHSAPATNSSIRNNSEQKRGTSPAKAWASAAASSSAVPNRASTDFPTAAEAASGKKAKLVLAPMAPQDDATNVAQKLQQAATADAFRGVHLDPKAHHWDEMEDEDGDDFLAGVIEFGDGTQYTVKSGAPAPGDPSLMNPPSLPEDQPISKEDRFVEDFDRRWPPTQAPSSSHAPPYTNHDISGLRPPDGRALFNERSNRFEAQRSFRGPDPHGDRPSIPPNAAWGRRNANDTGRDAPRPLAQNVSSRFPGRDAPHSGVHVLQKPAAPAMLGPDGLMGPRARGPSFDSPATSSAATSPVAERAVLSPASSTTALPPRPPATSERSRNVPPSPVYGSLRLDPQFGDPANHVPVGARDRSRESIRQAPPHLGRMGPPTFIPPPMNRRPSHGAIDRRDVPPAPRSVASSEALGSPSESLRSPSLSTPGLGHPLPPDGVSLKAPTMNDITSFSKESMHTAAERARERRKMEEEQREKDKERARRKAEELAALAEAKKKAEEEIAAATVKERMENEHASAIPVQSSMPASAPVPTTPVIPKPPSSDPVHTEEPERHVWRARSRAGSTRTSAPREESIPVQPRDAVQSQHPVPPPTVNASITAPSNPEAEKIKTGVPQPAMAASSTAPPAVPSVTERPSWASAVRGRGSRAETEGPEPLSSSRSSESWRSKTHTTSAPHVMPPVLSSLESSLEVKDDEQLEVVDFQDMDKLVGFGEETTQPPTLEPAFVLPSAAPVPAPLPLFERTSSWRRPPNSAPSDVTSISDAGKERPVRSPPGARSPLPLENLGSSIASLSPSSATDPSAFVPPPRPVGPASPTRFQFREAPMSALDDVMSRIKGAMSGIHPPESLAPPSQDDRRSSHRRNSAGEATSFAPRVRGSGSSRRSISNVIRDAHENFALSQLALSTAPPPPYVAKALVKIRRDPRRPFQAPVGGRLLHLWKLPPRPVRLDILSWDPPIMGLPRKTLSRDEFLFSEPSFPVTVSLPKTVGTDSTSNHATCPAPRVQLPASSSRRVGPPEGHDGASQPELSSTLFDPVSRSPPPSSPARKLSTSLPKGSVPSIGSPASQIQGADSASVSSAARTKAAPKLPAGADVAFYRHPRGSGKTQSTSSVSFTVTSELDDEPSEKKESASVGEDSTHQPRAGGHTKAFEVENEPTPSPVPTPTTPPHSHTTPWAKSPLVYSSLESSARNVAADPENIKMLWESTDKDVVTTENSLKGIADDFPTTMQFSVQDIKSDDGEDGKSPKAETPPPVPAPSARRVASRMSVHDAHRAFQQVPQSPPSSRNANSPLSQTPPASSSQPARPPILPLPAPNHHLNPRPFQGYAGSPGPMIYAPQYPLSSPQVGHQPLINAHPSSTAPQVWMPLNTPTVLQQQANFYPRIQPPPPYPQVMQYSPPASTYSPISGPLPKPAANGAPIVPIGRGRSVASSHLLSPIAASATPNGFPNGHLDQVRYPRGNQLSPPNMGYTGSPGPVYTVPGPAGRGVPMQANGFDPHAQGMYSPQTAFRSTQPW